MPLCALLTNVALAEKERTDLLHDLSRQTAEMLGKPERYVMVSLDAGRPMLFAGDDTPLAYLELKSIGLPEDRSSDFSNALCELMRAQRGIAPERVYIEFAGASRHLWGWNGATF